MKLRLSYCMLLFFLCFSGSAIGQYFTVGETDYKSIEIGANSGYNRVLVGDWSETLDAFIAASTKKHVILIKPAITYLNGEKVRFPTGLEQARQYCKYMVSSSGLLNAKPTRGNVQWRLISHDDIVNQGYVHQTMVLYAKRNKHLYQRNSAGNVTSYPAESWIEYTNPDPRIQNRAPFYLGTSNPNFQEFGGVATFQNELQGPNIAKYFWCICEW